MRKYELPSITTRAEAVILANGEYPEHKIPYSILYNSKYLVCCDGAIKNLENSKLNPNAIVGDCDSLGRENISKYTHIIHQSSEQETNDLTKSVNFCVSRGLRNILILGGTGKREDHTLGNISLLAEYLDLAGNIEMISNYGIFTPIKSDSQFSSFKGQQVSVFAIDRCEISVHNLKYPIENRELTNWWQGTLNESLGETFTVKTSGKVIIFRAF
ncbi:thiamine diphosphokinase [Viscerimonas tarda]